MLYDGTAIALRYGHRKSVDFDFFVRPATQRETASHGIGRVSDPEHLDGGPWIASPLDLLATKLTTLHDRVEVRDYVDIEVLLRAGIPLDRGIAAAHALFGTALNPLDTAKR